MLIQWWNIGRVRHALQNAGFDWTFDLQCLHINRSSSEDELRRPPPLPHLPLDPALTLTIFHHSASAFTSNSNHPSLVFPSETAVGHSGSPMSFRLLCHMYNRLYSSGRRGGEIMTFWVTASRHFLKTNHVVPRGLSDASFNTTKCLAFISAWPAVSAHTLPNPRGPVTYLKVRWGVSCALCLSRIAGFSLLSHPLCYLVQLFVLQICWSFFSLFENDFEFLTILFFVEHVLPVSCVGSLQVLGPSPTFRKHLYEVKCGIWTVTRCDCESEWLFVSMRPCNELVTHPRFPHWPSPNASWDSLTRSLSSRTSGWRWWLNECKYL